MGSEKAGKPFIYKYFWRMRAPIAMFMDEPVRFVKMRSIKKVAQRGRLKRRPTIQYVVQAKMQVGSTLIGRKSKATIAIKYEAVPYAPLARSLEGPWRLDRILTSLL